VWSRLRRRCVLGITQFSDDHADDDDDDDDELQELEVG